MIVLYLELIVAFIIPLLILLLVENRILAGSLAIVGYYLIVFLLVKSGDHLDIQNLLKDLIESKIIMYSLVLSSIYIIWLTYRGGLKLDYSLIVPIMINAVLLFINGQVPT